MKVLPLSTKYNYQTQNQNRNTNKENVNFAAVLATRETARTCSQQGLMPLGKVIAGLKDLVGQPVREFVRALRKKNEFVYLNKDEEKAVTTAFRAAGEEIAASPDQRLRPGIYDEFEPVEFADRWKNGTGKTGELKTLLKKLVADAEAHPAANAEAMPEIDATTLRHITEHNLPAMPENLA